MATEPDQPREDLERSTEITVTYGPEAVGRVRKVTTWVAGKAIDGTAKAVEYTGKAIQYAGQGVQAAGTGISAVGMGISSTIGAIPIVGIPFRVLGMGINGVGKGTQLFGKGVQGLGKGVESAGKGLGKVKQGFNNLGGLLKSGKNIAQLSKLAGGPVGWAMLAGNLPFVKQVKDIAKKIALGIGAYLLYLLLKFALKIAGAIVGFAFGAISGLPLLAIPVVGPFLYPAWVAYWTVRGWMDPIGTIHLATHPWEIFNKPLSWGKSAFNTVTGGPINVGIPVGSTLSGALSAVGSFFSGLASTIGGVVTGAAGGLFGAVTGAANFVVSGLGGAATAVAAGGPVTLVVGGTVAGVTTLGVLNQVNTATSFFSAQQDAVIGGTGDNELFTITKTASDNHFENEELPEDITYTITLTAKVNLSDISVSEKIEVQRKSRSGFAINRDADSNLINPPCGGVSSLTAGSLWTCQLRIAADSIVNFSDSIVTNTVTVTASQEGSAPVTDSAFAITTIGNPPVGCPNDWPTDHGYITQGPLGQPTHAKESADGWPAIDIAAPGGTPTYATFAGRIYRVVNDSWGDGFGTHVVIEADCDGKRFRAMWAHLKLNSIDPAIKVGTEVKLHQLIGEIDDTGASEGDHLHYAFNGLEMETPYIPQNPKTQDCSSAESCDVDW